MKKKKTQGIPLGFFVEIGGGGIIYKSTVLFCYAKVDAASNVQLG